MRRIWRMASMAAAGLALVALMGGTRPGKLPAPPRPFMGMQAIAKFDEGRQVGSWAGSRQRGLALDRDLGVQLSREGLIWHQLEPAPGAFSWADADDAIASCRQGGIAVQWMVTGTPYWASSAPRKRADSPQTFQAAPPLGLYEPICADGSDDWTPGKPLNPRQLWGTMLARAATRYRGQVRFWQIWNEPDFPTGDTRAAEDPARSFTGSARDYARMLRVAARVLHAIDPSARVATGGLGHPSYLQALLAAGAGADIDVLDFHAYGSGGSDGALRAFLSLHSRFAAVLRHAGLNTPMLCSETGYPSHDGDEQAAYIPKLYATGLALGLEGIAYYTNTNPSWRQMGLVDWRTLSRHTRGYAAYRSTATALGGMRFAGKLPCDPRVVAYRFEDRARRRSVVVAWAPYRKSEAALEWRSPLPAALVIDGSGATRSLEACGTLALSAMPVILDTRPARAYRPDPSPAPIALGIRGVISAQADHEDPTGFHEVDLAVDGDPDTEWVGPASASLTLELTSGPPIRALELKTGPLPPILNVEGWVDDHWEPLAGGYGATDWGQHPLAFARSYPGNRLRLVWRGDPGASAALFDVTLR